MLRFCTLWMLATGTLAGIVAGEPDDGQVTLATISVQVLKEGVAENQGIKLDLSKISVGSGDNIKILVDSGVFCPGGGAASGTITAVVPVNGCGFTAGNQVITEGGVLEKTIGPAGGGVTNFTIPITYSDSDCGTNNGPATVNLAVNCNGVDKGCCTVVTPDGHVVAQYPDITEADCNALPGTKIWRSDGTCIPTVSQWGLMAMTLLILSAATVVVKRRMVAA